MVQQPPKRSFADLVKGRRPESEDGSSGGFAGKFSKASGGGTGVASVDKKGKDFASSYAKKENKERFAQDASVVRKSRALNNQTFSDSTRKSRLDCVFLVRGKDNGRAAWHYVLVDKSKKEMFLAQSRSGSIDVAKYGEILYSGWGQDPSEDIKNKIKDEFGA